MTKIITSFALLLTSFLFAQGKFEQAMGNAMQLWGEGKNTEASAAFERIASAEKNSWLPNYYVAAVNTFAAFGTKDKEAVSAMLTKAQNALDIEMIKDTNNPEILVMQAMIHTAWIAFDPMTNGQKLSGKVMELYVAPANLKKSGIKSTSSFIKTIFMAGKFLFLAFISVNSFAASLQ